MSSDEDPAEPNIRARFDKLSSDLAARQAAEKPKGLDQGRYAEAGRGMNLGFRMLAEMIAGILVGLAVGWQLDRWFGTKPFLMIVFLFLGMAAGVLNVMRAATRSDPPGK